MSTKESIIRPSKLAKVVFSASLVIALFGLSVSIIKIQIDIRFLLPSYNEIYQINIDLSYYDESRSWDRNSTSTSCEDSRGTTIVDHIMSIPFCSYEMNVCNCRDNDETSSNDNIVTQLKRNQSIDTLQKILDCNSMKKRNPIVNFYSTAYNEPYESFLLLYAYRALKVHNDSFVEMVVSDIQQFIHMHQQALLFLLNQFGYDTICVRQFHNTTLNRTVIPNTWRYLEPPIIMDSTYTYIGDVDILFTESVLDVQRFEQMKYFDIPYSNIVRPLDSRKRKRLTGVMLVKTNEFYTPKLLNEQSKFNEFETNNDEQYLYHLVERSELGLPKKANESDIMTIYRPLHGIHLSNSRGPGKPMCLPKKYIYDCSIFNDSKFNDFLCQDRGNGFQTVSKFFNAFHEQVLHKMTVIDGVCQAANVL